MSRDHRKTLTIDGRIGFVTGLCVGRAWVGIPEKKIDPWRDTGIEVRGPSVADIEQAFASVWNVTGEELPADEIANAGDVLKRTVIRKKARNGTAVSTTGELMPTIFRFLPRARSAFVISPDRTKSLILKRLLYKQRRFNSN